MLQVKLDQKALIEFKKKIENNSSDIQILWYIFFKNITQIKKLKL